MQKSPPPECDGTLVRNARSRGLQEAVRRGPLMPWLAELVDGPLAGETVQLDDDFAARHHLNSG